jgi:hypothetical protein
MSQLEVADNNAAADTERASSAYVPPREGGQGAADRGPVEAGQRVDLGPESYA